MSAAPLPRFRYHPDPIATGSIEKSLVACVCCGQARGYVYVGPVYGVEEYDREICPWCIAAGSSHARLAVAFMDREGVGGRNWSKVPESVAAEVAYRTPGLADWQQERWFAHCGDAACFLGPAGFAELTAAGPVAVDAVRIELGWGD